MTPLDMPPPPQHVETAAPAPKTPARTTSINQTVVKEKKIVLSSDRHRGPKSPHKLNQRQLRIRARRLGGKLKRK